MSARDEVEEVLAAQDWASRNMLPEPVQHPREPYMPPAQRLEEFEHCHFPDWPGHDVNRALPMLPLRWWLAASAALCLSCVVAYLLLA